MLRPIITSLLLMVCFSICAQVSANDSAAEQTQVTDKQRIAHLERAIANDLKALGKAKGEMIDFTEYRIKNKTYLLREEIKTLINAEPLDVAYVKPLVMRQFEFLDLTSDYLDNKISHLQQSLGGKDDQKIIDELIDRQYMRDHFLQAQHQTIIWAEKLAIDVSQRKQQLTELLSLRADRQESLANYTQTQLKEAVDDVANAGADASAEQKALVVAFKNRLAQSSSSLSVSAELLDNLGQDTTQIRQTLFNVSGDITKDVLNISLVSSLVKQWGDVIATQAIEHGPELTFKVFIFVLILVLSGMLAKLVNRIVSKTVRASKLNFSQLLQDFFISLSSKTVYALGLLVALSQLGFELGPLLAGFGIAGVIIGFALQDTLSNFASGMMILIYRPYDVGDLINAAGVTGKVSHMSLVSTTIKTLDNQRLIIPNNKIWGDTINNITVERLRRVDMVFGISYSDNIEHAEEVLKDIVSKHELVCAEPEPMVKLHTLNSSSVDFVVRPWVKPADYWEVYWDITRSVKLRFDEEGISIPFPQRDVHVYQTAEE
ncbi:mechanosensitive ion channel family protein [Shewanella sp. WXL01]|uniref:mechanosensitive ion channel family protein n=1 Tax=Shewanella sp. WXL01 TaxID=2709721 RepID=UPI00143851FA|nr:mechanosensitive ion channel family protein [Shewanella sp. WXL01]NKF51201.1 mechanosensitive ion channel family protein [Shewanella sp. WXL01]